MASDSCCGECDELGIGIGQTGATGPTGPSGITTLLLGAENIFVSKDGDDATGTNKDLTKSFLTIANAIVKASALAPSSTNIINLIVYPGAYSENFTIPQYVNLIAVTPNELLYNGVSYATVATKSANALRPVYVNGTITVESDNVNIIGVNCNTLAVNTTGTNCSFNHMVVSTAITASGNVGANFYDVHSLAFLTTNGALSGYYKYCSGGAYSFASRDAASGGTISGIMEDCVGDTVVFASSNSSTGGTISGTLRRCIANNTSSFASSASSTAGTISGILEDCYATGATCFGSSTSGTGGTLSGYFFRCRANTTKSFGYGVTAGTLSGQFIECVADAADSFGCFSTTGADLSGEFFRCVSREARSFGTTTSGSGATLSGKFVDCAGGDASFGCSTTGTAATLSGTFENCKAYDVDNVTYCFASSVGGTAGVISGKLVNCIGVGASFCSSDTTGGTVSSTGQLINCISTTDMMLRKAVVSGKVIGARINQTNANEPCIIVGGTNTAVIAYCKLKSNGSGNAVHATAAINASVTFCSLFGFGLNANVTNVVTTPYNIDQTGEYF